MRTGIRAAAAAVLAAALVVGTTAPALSRAATTVTVTAAIDSVTCNPDGEPGLVVTATATATGGRIGHASLYVGEFGPVSDPAYAPFPWTGSTLANWSSYDTWRRGVATDARTLHTRDAATWNVRNHAVDLWSASSGDAWWIVDYAATAIASRATGPTEGRQRWYVRCPAGTVVDGLALKEIRFVEEPGLR